MSVQQEARITLRVSDTMLRWVAEQAQAKSVKPSAIWRLCLAMGRERIETGTSCGDARHMVHLAELERWRQVGAQADPPFVLPADVTGWEFTIISHPPRPGVTDLTGYDVPSQGVGPVAVFESLPEGWTRVGPHQVRNPKGVVEWTGPRDADGNPLYEEGA